MKNMLQAINSKEYLSFSNLPVVCLMGPTATGKSQLAIELCHKFPFHIVSVDSAMVYRGMNIGTAKPSPTELALTPHELVDICDPSEPYSAGHFCNDAIAAIKTIHHQQKIPLLVGGTMLYFAALQRGLAPLPTANAAIRENLNQQAEEIGWEAMHLELAKFDPISAKKIKPQDKQRIQRALEVYLLSGTPLSTLQQQKPPAAYTFINLALGVEDRSILHERIKNRVKSMFDQGFLAEVNRLYHQPQLNAQLPAMRSVGYRQIWQFFQENGGSFENHSYDLVREKVVIATRQLAKRQFTWLRSWSNLIWFDSDDSNLLDRVGAYLSGILNL